MKNRVLIIVAGFTLITVLSSCGVGTDNNDTDSKQPSVSSGSPAVSQSPDVTASPELSEKPTETAESSTVPASGTPAVTTESAEPTDGKPSPSEDQGGSLISDAEFSIKIGKISLTLRENDIEGKLDQLPLSLISDNTEVLGEGSDTFTGSYLRTIKYDGLELTMIAPKDNKDNFWVIQMKVTGAEVLSYRNVKVGDSFETLMKQYPNAERSTKDSAEEYRFLTGSEEDIYDELAFEISDGTITQITLTYFMP